MTHLLTVPGLTDDEIRSVLDRAQEAGRSRRGHEPFTLGVGFFSPSMRTRAGFIAAAQRLGGQAIEVTEARFDPSMSSPESVEDTLRTMDDLCDVLVVRGRFDLASIVEAPWSSVPVINGGDRRDHPTQALIDLHTIRAEVGEVAGRRIGISGDLTMRAVRSLLDLLGRFDPAEVVCFHPEGRALPDVPSTLRDRISVRSAGEFAGLDVLYLPGLPAGEGAGALDDEARRPYALGPHNIATLDHRAVVLSPLPVIDEIDPAVVDDPRVRPWATQHQGLAVRMAVLEQVLTS